FRCALGKFGGQRDDVRAIVTAPCALGPVVKLETPLRQLMVLQQTVRPLDDLLHPCLTACDGCRYSGLFQRLQDTVRHAILGSIISSKLAAYRVDPDQNTLQFFATKLEANSIAGIEHRTSLVADGVHRLACPVRQFLQSLIGNAKLAPIVTDNVGVGSALL